MHNIEQYCNLGSLICVSISFAPIIQVLQIIMLILSIILTLSGLIAKIMAKIKDNTLTVDDINEAKKTVDEIVDKIDDIKGDKDE